MIKTTKMVFIRIKGIKNKYGIFYYYAYKVKSKYIKKEHNVKQIYIKYMGKVDYLTPLDKKMLFNQIELKCNFCGTPNNLEIDHIIPLSLNGTNNKNNIQILCGLCNKKKGKK